MAWSFRDRVYKGSRTEIRRRESKRLVQFYLFFDHPLLSHASKKNKAKHSPTLATLSLTCHQCMRDPCWIPVESHFPFPSPRPNDRPDVPFHSIAPLFLSSRTNRIESKRNENAFTAKCDDPHHSNIYRMYMIMISSFGYHPLINSKLLLEQIDGKSSRFALNVRWKCIFDLRSESGIRGNAASRWLII